MRKFEKISFEQFKKDICDDENLYNEYKLPERKTSLSAGYDLLSINDFVIKPGEILTIPTGYKIKLNPNEVLLLVVRSSMGFKYNVRMCNQIGVIDADFYNNPANEGHFYVKLQNEGNQDYVVKKGDAYSQGIIINYLTCDDVVETSRQGGLGSTNNND